jgi:HEPN domain-containing protein
MTRKDFQKLTRLRLRDAKALLKSGNNEGAYYLAGLAVECALKSAIARKTQRHDFPPDPKFVRESVYAHDLNKLLAAAGLESSFNAEAAHNVALRTNWALVKDGKVESRYLLSGLNGNALYRAAAGRNGVLGWLRQHW